MNFEIKQVGGLRLALLVLSASTLPLVAFADMPPRGIGVITAYVVPALVVLLFLVLLLDALMNRVFMIEQSAADQAVRRLRLRWDLAISLGILAVWGWHFRTLLDT